MGTNMKAIQVDGDGLVWADYATSECGPGEIRIQIKATAIKPRGFNAAGRRLCATPRCQRKLWV